MYDITHLLADNLMKALRAEGLSVEEAERESAALIEFAQERGRAFRKSRKAHA